MARAYDISMAERKTKATAEAVLDYRKKILTPADIAHARAVVAANAQCEEAETPRCVEDARSLLEHLGLMPGQDDWYQEDDPLMRRPSNG